MLRGAPKLGRAQRDGAHVEERLLGCNNPRRSKERQLSSRATWKSGPSGPALSERQRAEGAATGRSDYVEERPFRAA